MNLQVIKNILMLFRKKYNRQMQYLENYGTVILINWALEIKSHQSFYGHC